MPRWASAVEGPIANRATDANVENRADFVSRIVGRIPHKTRPVPRLVRGTGIGSKGQRWSASVCWGQSDYWTSTEPTIDPWMVQL